MYNEETDNFAKLLDSREQSKSFAKTLLAEDYYNYVSSTYLYGAIGEDRLVIRIHPEDIEYSGRLNIPTTDAAVGVAKLLGMFYDGTNKLEETIEMTLD